MKKIFAVCFLAITSVSLTLANTISGTMSWANGTLVYQVTPKPAAQNVTLKIGANNVVFTNVFVTGNPIPIPQGAPFEILKNASQPFVATFPTSSNISASAVLGG